MRPTLTHIAIAALAAAWCVPAASEQETERVPARVSCSRDGKVVGITAMVTGSGVFTLEIPPDICQPVQERQRPAAPRPPASTSRRTQI
jgi:hypothetical protein